MNSNPHSTETDLRRAEEQFRLVVESSPAAMVIVDQSGRIVLVNRQTEAWFGYARDELIGRQVEVLIPHRFHDRHRGDRNGFLQSPQARPMGAGHDLFAKRKDGTEFPVDISLHPMETEGGILVMAHVVDLTDRKQAELELKRRHSMERLALLGQLAGGVAHEIRNPLGVIRNSAYYLQMVRDSLDEAARESVAEIQQEVERADNIVSDLLDYARDPRQHREMFDLAARVREVSARLGPSLANPLEIQISEPSIIHADPDQVERILINLIRNAAQASSDGSLIDIRLSTTATSAIVEVTDQGEGIPESDRARIFEPLFTTKAKGIGLGLAVSRRYAERNDGDLSLVDRTGPGTTFRLTFPLACENGQDG